MIKKHKFFMALISHCICINKTGLYIFLFYTAVARRTLLRSLDHFTVFCIETRPLNSSAAGDDLLLTQTSPFLLCKSICFNANYVHLHDRNREVSIKARSSPASLPFKDQVHEQTTVHCKMANSSFPFYSATFFYIHPRSHYFQIASCLCFKTSLSAKPFMQLPPKGSLTHFHMTSFSRRLVLKQRHKETFIHELAHRSL